MQRLSAEELNAISKRIIGCRSGIGDSYRPTWSSQGVLWAWSLNFGAPTLTSQILRVVNNFPDGSAGRARDT
jgi:hypothetical protein